MTNICMVIVTAPACSARSVSGLVQNLSPRVVGLSQKADSDDDVKPPKDVPKLLSGRKKPKNKTNVCVCGCERYQGKGSQLSTKMKRQYGAGCRSSVWVAPDKVRSDVAP